MPVLTEAQRTELVVWKSGIDAVLQLYNQAVGLIDDILRVDGSALLNGNVSIDTVWTQLGERWNDLRKDLIDAAKEVPRHE